MEFANLAISVVSTLAGALVSWGVSLKFYKKQLKDQQERDRVQYQEKLEEQKRQQIQDVIARQENEYRAERERLYQKRLSRFHEYDISASGLSAQLTSAPEYMDTQGSAPPDLLTVENESEETFLAVSLEFPPSATGGFTSLTFGRLGTLLPREGVTLPLPESVYEPDVILIRAYRSTTSVPIEVSVPLDPNFTMREYRESGSNGTGVR